MNALFLLFACAEGVNHGSSRGQRQSEAEELRQASGSGAEAAAADAWRSAAKESSAVDHDASTVTERGACTSSNASAAEGGGANGQSYGSAVNQDTSYPGGANKWCLNIRADGNNGRLLDCTHGVYLVCCAGEGCDQGGDFHFIPGDLMDRYLGQLFPSAFENGCPAIPDGIKFGRLTSDKMNHLRLTTIDLLGTVAFMHDKKQVPTSPDKGSVPSPSGAGPQNFLKRINGQGGEFKFPCKPLKRSELRRATRGSPPSSGRSSPGGWTTAEEWEQIGSPPSSRRSDRSSSASTGSNYDSNSSRGDSVRTLCLVTRGAPGHSGTWAPGSTATVPPELRDVFQPPPGSPPRLVGDELVSLPVDPRAGSPPPPALPPPPERSPSLPGSPGSRFTPGTPPGSPGTRSAARSAPATRPRGGARSPGSITDHAQKLRKLRQARIAEGALRRVPHAATAGASAETLGKLGLPPPPLRSDSSSGDLDGALAGATAAGTEAMRGVPYAARAGASAATLSKIPVPLFQGSSSGDLGISAAKTDAAGIPESVAPIAARAGLPPLPSFRSSGDLSEASNSPRAGAVAGSHPVGPGKPDHWPGWSSGDLVDVDLGSGASPQSGTGSAGAPRAAARAPRRIQPITWIRDRLGRARIYPKKRVAK